MRRAILYIVGTSQLAMRGVSRGSVSVAVLVLVVSGLSGGSTVQKAEAATGELVGSVTFSVDCGLGVGIAFDGSNLWYSCHQSTQNLRRADATTGVVTATYDIPVSAVDALSYDATRNAIWAAVPFNNVYRIDLDASKNVTGSTFAFSVADSCSIIDGLAFDARNVADPNDDVFYYSDDCWTTIVDLYDVNGSSVESFASCQTGGHNSGLAVGGQLLYQADVFNSVTCVVDKTTKAPQFSYSNAVPGDPNFHPEDMECDTSTFAGLGKHVMWQKEAYSPARAHAFEIPFGSCGVGGQPPGGPELELAQMFAPRLWLVNGDYEPEEVGIFLNCDGADLVANGPSPIDCPDGHDLQKNAGDTNYLDIPGIQPGDDAAYANAYAALSGSYDLVTYADVIETGRYVNVDYWLFYYYNDYNRCKGPVCGQDHEGDWERIRVRIKARGTERALSIGEDLSSGDRRLVRRARNKVHVWYSQHTCDDPLGSRPWEKWHRIQSVDSTHPVAYVAKGSHANFFDNGENGTQGKGLCTFGDETSTDVFKSPRVILIDCPSSDGWLAFAGAWGEGIKARGPCVPR